MGLKWLDAPAIFSVWQQSLESQLMGLSGQFLHI